LVFVGGGNAHFYALNALTGKVIWQAVLGSSPSHFLWSSPLVYNGSVYIGVASFGDCPWVQGQLIQMNAATGVIQHRFNVVPAGCTGGSVWSSPVVDQMAGTMYIATGNTGKCSTAQRYAEALVQLRASDLTALSSWSVPQSTRTGDTDFGASPTLFQATIGGISRKLVGVVSKNGIYYAFDRTAIRKGPVWQAKIAVPGNDPLAGEGSISSSAWDGSNLYVAGGSTTINGSTCKGSLRALIPATGTFLWEHCLNGLNDAPVVGEGKALVLIATASGSTLFTFSDLSSSSIFYGSASISNGVLYAGNADGYLYALGL
jgi:polyvinyl alcohol dehydrogenase (cytochrome)